MLGIVFTTVSTDRDSAIAPLPPSDVRGGLVSTAALPQFYPAALFPERYTLRVPVYADGAGRPTALADSGLGTGKALASSGTYGPALGSTYSLPFESPVYEPTISPVEAATIRTAAYGGSLSEDEMIAVLVEAGWTEHIDEAMAVAFCESRYRPGVAGDSGRSVGIFQVNLQTWFPYAGEDPEQWMNPVVNARVALRVYEYDISRGQDPWTQWSCKP